MFQSDPRAATFLRDELHRDALGLLGTMAGVPGEEQPNWRIPFQDLSPDVFLAILFPLENSSPDAPLYGYQGDVLTTHRMASIRPPAVNVAGKPHKGLLDRAFQVDCLANRRNREGKRAGLGRSIG
jgi:hypothetical protein